MNLQAWLDLLERRHPTAIDMGLDRCGAVYRLLGSPRPARQVYTVAGTNGKGSTVAYVAALCSALGQRCGTYTSPHIFRFNERIHVLGTPVSDEQLVAAFEQVEAAREDISLTYFEFSTLAAFLVLNQADLDCAVLEVGLGGRLDTVNLVDADCVVITPIGLDHQDFLGPDIPSIAREKAGVIRGSAITVCTEAEPPGPILDTATTLDSTIRRRGLDFDIVVDDTSGGSSNEALPLLFTMGERAMAVPSPAMGGRHQVDNLAAALAAVSALNPRIFANAGEVADAIAHCRLPGRLQQVASSPDIFLDVGHNELAAGIVAEFLATRGGSDVTIVLSMLVDKPAEAVALTLDSICRRWLCAASEGARGQTGGSLARRIETVLPKASISSFESVAEAMAAAVGGAEEDETILVFGSFTTVEAAATWLRNHMQHDGGDAARITADETASKTRGSSNG